MKPEIHTNNAASKAVMKDWISRDGVKETEDECFTIEVN